MDTTVGLDEVGPDDLADVGGKAANLGVLLRAGVRVPDGFCVRTDAYRRVAAVACPEAAPDARSAREALLDGAMPDDVAAAVLAAYRKLGDDVPVAVRSSATAEDLPTASFAGQQDTYLNVVGETALLDAVRHCWASLWTDRAVEYRARNGIDPSTVALAVVVQRMVEVAVAGVLFTADPVSGRRTRTVIDAAPGLGEAVVSGAVNPDHVTVEADGSVAGYRVGDKGVAVRPVAGGGVSTVASDGDPVRCLDDAQIAELVALGRRVEADFGAPQDIEWAIAPDGTLWTTQSRPITTLHPLPPPGGPGLRVHVCVSLAQGLTGPLTPMGISAIRVVASSVAGAVFGFPVADRLTGPPALGVAGGRVFVDATPVLRSAAGRRLVPMVLDVMEARSAVVLRGLFDRPEFSLRTTSWRPFATRLLRALAHFRIPPVVVMSLLSPAAGLRHVEGARRRTRGLAPSRPGAGPHERVDHAVDTMGEVFTAIPAVAPVAAAGFVALGAARKLAGPDLDAAGVHEVLRSLPHNCTTEMDLELWDVATRVRADAASAAALSERPAPDLAIAYRQGALPPVLDTQLHRFLAEHGHRAVAEIDLGVLRWSDDPSYLLGVLAGYLRTDDPDAAPDVRFARGARAAEDAVRSVVAAVRRRSRLRAAAVRFALGRTRRLAGLREEHKDLLVRRLAHARRELASVGTDLAARGLLDDAEDVFSLELTEVRTALDGADHRATVADRKAEHAREALRRHVPRVLLSDGTEPEALAAGTPTPGALTGSAASAGVATGPARVVLDPAGAHLEPGEILVCPSTDPGWTPLFLTAGGLVMEMGGSNSHGAVVAREYGIPAVVGVPAATSTITTGATVTVDGAAGEIRIAR
ncbi:PEP/pyruvate-binding domain-containing protein [Pseudonocardia endophytica]|uniref:Pyruvate,water dikinase n=1 Tax=Pseudonocardia endophytica TaxID=401976 RepID=A0A4R1HQC4_PSEEN|nr:PEP/pyruvate-binding domain-containing protein [Pseudonocardia endophytica]TCK24784.1 pyruvate,water dikinase [Pseudonocardia endophytica]